MFGKKRRKYKSPSWIRKNKKKKYYNQTKISKLERNFQFQILEPMCERFGLEYVAQKKIKSKFYDFYIPKIRLLIEVDGDYYHGKDRKKKKMNKMQKKNILNDHYKNKLALETKNRIIRFWGSDIRKNTSLVKVQLKNRIKKLIKN